MNRKRLIDLTTEDLLENPVWEYWMAENVEYVRASGKTEITEDSNATHIVVTDFIFNNKSKHLGFCSPKDQGSLDDIQPVVITVKGHVEFFRENDWTENEKGKALTKLGFEWKDVFPLVYTTRVKFDRKFYTGTLQDFNEGQ